MFALLPLQVRDKLSTDTIPFGNAILIAANVIVFFLTQSFGWSLGVGHGTSAFAILTYAFAHANLAHLLGNVWLLWLFGNPVNRRLGNGYYLLAYLCTALALGIIARVFADGVLRGASGAVFAVLLLFMMLYPAARVRVGYVALFPITLVIGLVSRPGHWLYWFFRFGNFHVTALWGLMIIPCLELWGLWWSGWDWANLGHLLGLACGIAIILLLPTRITMRRRPEPEGAY